MERIHIIANPKAGKGRAVGKAERLAALLTAAGAVAHVDVPGSRQEAVAHAGEAVDAGCDCLVVCGGDGSLAGILDLAARSDTALGVLPAGRGNDFARGLGAGGSCEALVAAVGRGRTRPVDLGAVDGQSFATVVGCGLDAEVGRAAIGGTAVGGMAGYVIEALRHLRTFRGFAMCLEVDGRVVHDGDTTLVACANTSTYGGGFRVAPGADPADGRLDVCVVRGVGRFEAASLLPQLAIGTHVGHPAVSLFAASEVRVTAAEPLVALADGEVAGQVPFTVTVRPGALRVVA